MSAKSKQSAFKLSKMDEATQFSLDQKELFERGDRMVTPEEQQSISDSASKVRQLRNDLDAESARATEAEVTNADRIAAEKQRAITKEQLLESDITNIKGVIPGQASPQNQLADKNFVNSSIQTSTADYITNNGVPFNSLAELQAYAGKHDVNDYAFVKGQDATGNTTYTRYKFTAEGIWAEEYVLNNSSFTSTQWAAIESGITSGDKAKLDALPTKAQLDAILAGKLDTIQLVTYSILKGLRDNGELVAGQQYIITDYATTTSQAETRSAGHNFDILVKAISTTGLSEIASAIRHAGDTYFANAKVNAWELKYCLDNDTARFHWADSAGKGVIYEMKDEFGNVAPYDFKNIQFARYKITAVENSNINSLVGMYLGFKSVDSPSSVYPSGTTVQNTAVYRYTFCRLSGTTSYDISVAQYGQNNFYCHGNIIRPYFNGKKMYLPNFVLGGDGYDSLYGNEFGENCRDFSAYRACYNNHVGNEARICSIGQSFNNNTIGNNFRYNSIGQSFGGNTIGNDFYNNSIGQSFSDNTIGNYFNYNTIGNNAYYNTIGEWFNNNTIGLYFQNNTIGQYFQSNSIGNSFQSNSIGLYFQYNTIGNNFYRNSIGNNTIGNIIGDDICGMNATEGFSGKEITMGLPDFDYGYDSWTEDGEDPETGDTLVSGVDGVHLNIGFGEEHAGEEAHLRVVAKHAEGLVVLYDGDVTTDSEGHGGVEDLSGTWDACRGEFCVISYEAKWKGNGMDMRRVDYDSY